jgi:hypothetical protein
VKKVKRILRDSQKNPKGRGNFPVAWGKKADSEGLTFFLIPGKLAKEVILYGKNKRRERFWKNYPGVEWNSKKEVYWF